MNLSIILAVAVVTSTVIHRANSSNGERDCCDEVKIVYNGNNDVYERYPFLFTMYKMMKDNITYISQDEKYVLAICDGRWMIQRTENRLKQNCWKMALTAEDPHQCPSDLGQTWTYRERKGQQNVWLEAGGGMEVICNQVDCTWNEWGAWSSCSETCGIGDQQRSRSRVKEASYDGKNCSGDFIATQKCSINPCPIDCTWGGWEPWGDCTKTCNGGVQLRTRLFFAGNSAKMCSGQSATLQECNTNPCPTDTPSGIYMGHS